MVDSIGINNSAALVQHDKIADGAKNINQKKNDSMRVDDAVLGQISNMNVASGASILSAPDPIVAKGDINAIGKEVSTDKADAMKSNMTKFLEGFKAFMTSDSGKNCVALMSQMLFKLVQLGIQQRAASQKLAGVAAKSKKAAIQAEIGTMKDKAKSALISGVITAAVTIGMGIGAGALNVAGATNSAKSKVFEIAGSLVNSLTGSATSLSQSVQNQKSIELDAVAKESQAVQAQADASMDVANSMKQDANKNIDNMISTVSAIVDGNRNTMNNIVRV